MKKLFPLGMALSLYASSACAESMPLPEPLTLSDALTHVAPDHPLYQLDSAKLLNARAAEQRAAAGLQLRSSLILDGRYADKAITPETNFIDDSRVKLQISKLLTDFGRTRNTKQAAETVTEGLEVARNWHKRLHEIDIMRRFFDVHLADLRYFVDDEDMTLSFFPFNRRLERLEKFEEFSMLEVKQYEAGFRKKLTVRAAMANRQRITRNRLALALGRPGELPDQVVTPDLSAYDRPIPDYDELLERVLNQHPAMKLNGMMQESAKLRLEAAGQANNPRLSMRLEAQEFALKTGGNRDELLAGVIFEMPFGSRVSRGAEQAGVQADLDRLRAERRELEFDLRQQVLELVLKLDELQFARQAALVNEEYRQLYVDRSRTLYEMEVRSDLGDSQARQAEALWEAHKVEYEWVETWARIDAMQGLPLAILPANSEEQ